MQRRTFILTSLALVTAFSQRVIAKLKATPSQFEGPFYPVVPIPLDNDLINHAGGTAKGEQLELSGVIKNAEGQPLADTLIEIWQCDATGRYRHPRAAETELVDKHFAGFGAVKTAANGEYHFNTLMPVPYTGRPPHIHIKLHRGGKELLTSQIYLKGEEEEGGLLSTLARAFGDRSTLVIDPVSIAANRRKAQFDIVIEESA